MIFADAAAALAVDGEVARGLDGYEARPQQVEMAMRVAQTMQQRGRLLIEAGTGVGKSFAYLLPAIERIVSHGERVVVATNTINLQEQLFSKDIPVLAAIAGSDLKPVLVKGRGNYLSRRRLKVAVSRQDRLVRNAQEGASLHQLQVWAETTLDGTRSSLPVLSAPRMWEYAQSDSGNCLGRRCPTFEDCFFQMARREMETGNLLVCNHALFFSDLALRIRGGSMLPAYDHVILDEAHAIEDVAAEHFGLKISESQAGHLLGLLWQAKGGKGFLGMLESTASSVVAARNAVDVAADAVESFFSALLLWQAGVGGTGRITKPGIVENEITPAFDALVDALSLVRGQLDDEAPRIELAGYVQRTQQLAVAARALIGQELQGCVYWLDGIEQRRDATGRVRPARPALHCMVVDVAEVLQRTLFKGDHSITLTSATLSTGPGEQGFDHIKARLGCPEADAVQVGSPFHFSDQMTVLIDSTMPEPRSANYLDRLSERVLQLVRRSGGGAFVLCTSFRVINELMDRIGDALAGIGGEVLVQGRDGPPSQLLDRFRAIGDGVLVGTSSFWHGVDVRGAALRSVIITRIPFEVPDRPLVEARAERVVAAGGNAFMHDAVPRALIRFRQGVGRLIRSSRDEGTVAVLDSRVVTKPYGRLFLQALPDGVAIHDLASD